MDGMLTAVEVDEWGSSIITPVPVGEDVIPLESAADFSETGGQCLVGETVYDYISADHDLDTITLAKPVTAALDEDDVVKQLLRGQVATEAVAVVDIDGGDIPDELIGDNIRIRLSYYERPMWPVQTYDPPLPVWVSDDLTSIAAAPGHEATMDSGEIPLKRPFDSGHIRVMRMGQVVFVYGQGVYSSDGAEATVANLPEQFRPAATRYFNSSAMTGGARPYRFTIDAEGVVKFRSSGASAFTQSLSGIYFVDTASGPATEAAEAVETPLDDRVARLEAQVTELFASRILPIDDPEEGQ